MINTFGIGNNNRKLKGSVFSDISIYEASKRHYIFTTLTYTPLLYPELEKKKIPSFMPNGEKRDLPSLLICLIVPIA